MRYHTSSSRKNANPAAAAPASTMGAGAMPAGSRESVSFSFPPTAAPRHDRLSTQATTATSRFAVAASQTVSRVPTLSKSQKVAARQPTTAPSVFQP